MRVSADTQLLGLIPGQRADIILNVVNTGEVIDGVTARIVGLPEQHVSSRPTVLPLFPDSSGQLTLTLELPTSFPAGRHPMTVEVHSRQPGTAPAYVAVDLVVSQAAALTIGTTPQLIRAHRSGRFILTVTNRGNVALDVALKANDPQKAMSVALTPSRLTVPPGQAGDVIVTVRGPRMIMGTDLDRVITLTGLARPVDLDTELALLPAAASSLSGTKVLPGPAVWVPPAPMPPTGRTGEFEEATGAAPLPESATITLRQRPWFTRGMMTALILLTILGLWATAAVFVIHHELQGDALTKTAPASFFASSAAANQPTGVWQAATSCTGTKSAPRAAGPPPPGSLPKTGALPPGLGGAITGTATAATDGKPVGGIRVEALRTTANGCLVQVSFTATQSDGTYLMVGLFPDSYQLRFSADGFTTTFYRAAATRVASTAVVVTSGAVITGADAVITGKTATIKGSIDPGNTIRKVVASVTVRLLAGGSPGKIIAPVTTSADFNYTIPNLPAPGSYQLSFIATGYLPTTAQIDVTGGDLRFAPTVLLWPVPGQIAGTVTDGRKPLGGITVSTTVKGVAVSTDTATTGQIGQFVLDQLPTPATYAITLTGPGFTTRHQVINLGPGATDTTEKFTLDEGAGTVTGVLIDTTGAGIGGAVVTVGGAANPPTTTTLTAGVIGTFSLSGLASPGQYTLIFTLPGHPALTVPLNLPGPAPAAPLKVVMGALGAITGQVTGQSGAPLSGASVIATDGKRTWPGTSTQASGAVSDSGNGGGYVIDQLPTGTYTVTATSPTGVGRTAVVTVTPGGTTTQNFPLPGSR